MYERGRYTDNTEVSNASALPEPTRLDTARPESAGQRRVAETLGGSSGLAGLEVGGEGQGLVVQDALSYSDDELAVLAESFFQQRSGNLVGSVDEWWNTGNL